VQGYVTEEGPIGVDDISRWSLDAIGFLKETTAAASVEELMKVSQF
jgi:hypothetical protein